MSSRTLSIIIPCYNEEAAIAFVLNRYLEFKKESLQRGVFPDVELIVVDDKSTDRSAELVRQHPAGAELLILEVKRGYGGAIKEGIQKARGELIAFYDMDATYDPFDLFPMYDSMISAKASVASGDRLSLMTEMGWVRRLGNRFYVVMTSLLFRRSVNDCCTGLRLFDRAHAQEFIQYLPDTLDFTLAMTIHLFQRRVSVVETPITYRERLGESKLDVFRDGVRFLLTILRMWIKLRV